MTKMPDLLAIINIFTFIWFGFDQYELLCMLAYKSLTSISEQSPEVSFHGLLPSMQDEPDAISSIQDSIQANSNVHEHDPINDPTFKSVGGEADGGEIFDNDSQSSTLPSIRDMLIGWQNDEATDLRKENILRAGALV